MDESKLRELIKSIVRELNVAEDDDLEEITTTGDVAGYNTPHAFSDKKKDEKRRKKSAEVFGYKLVKEVEDIINEKDDDKGRKQYKPGDVWKRKDGTWAGKNSKGSIQGYKSKEDAEKWASNEVPSDEKEKPKDEPKEKPTEEPENDETEDEDDGDDNDGDKLKDKVKDFFKSSIEKGKAGYEKGKGKGEEFADFISGEKIKDDIKLKGKIIKEELNNKDIKVIKELIRDVISDVLRDIWIKRNSWK